MEQAKGYGIDYLAAVQRAEHRDMAALHVLFGFTLRMDGAAADSHCAVLHLLLAKIGDQSFSSALRREPANVRNRVTEAIDFDIGRPWQKSFPLTYALGSHDRKLLHGDSR